jgi:hypothetical protein
MTNLRTIGLMALGLLSIGASQAGEATAQVPVPPVGLSESEFEELLAAELTFDLASLVPPGTLVVDDYCYQDTIFGCLGRVDATISGIPEPSLTDFSVDAGTTPAMLPVDITLQDLAITANVVAVTGVGFSCTVDVTSSTTSIATAQTLSEAPSGNGIDAVQLGGTSVTFAAFPDTTDCAGFMGSITDFFIDLFVTNLQTNHLRPALLNYVDALDGDSNTPVAAALETVYAEAPQPVPALGPLGFGVLGGVLISAGFVRMRSSSK